MVAETNLKGGVQHDFPNLNGLAIITHNLRKLGIIYPIF